MKFMNRLYSIVVDYHANYTISSFRTVNCEKRERILQMTSEIRENSGIIIFNFVLSVIQYSSVALPLISRRERKLWTLLYAANEMNLSNDRSDTHAKTYRKKMIQD